MCRNNALSASLLPLLLVVYFTLTRQWLCQSECERAPPQWQGHGAHGSSKQGGLLLTSQLRVVLTAGGLQGERGERGQGGGGSGEGGQQGI